MGYTTAFTGKFKFNKKLDKETYDLLIGLATTRRMKRKVAKKYGVEGEFYCEDRENFGQGGNDNIVDYNTPPKTQPGLWLQWIPTKNGRYLEWDGVEKFYNYVEWLEYLIKKILKPKGYALNGKVKWSGEDRSDIGTIVIEDNKVSTIRVKNAPKFRDYDMNPVKYNADDDTYEKVDEDDPDISKWSVYGINSQGFHDCIADFVYREHAEFFLEQMQDDYY